MPRNLSRRSLFGLAGAAGVAGAVGVLEATNSSASVPDTVPFLGTHQAGILTPQQDRLHLVALDLSTTSRSDVVALLQQWTAAAARLTAGRAIGGGALPSVIEAPPDDTGEAQGLQASLLTITFGIGGHLLDTLKLPRPDALVDLPHFAGDALEDGRSDGDLVIQACANDPQVAVHAVRNLVRIAHGTATVRWSQLGFGRTSSTTSAQETPRNLFGFKDGTHNAVSDIWVKVADGPSWMVNGSYMVVRRIGMTIEAWDRSSLDAQQQTIGRYKGSGAPLGLTHERDPLKPLTLPIGSHVREASADVNNGAELLRRGYSFVDGSDGLGHLDAGLCFIAYQRDPRTAFIPIQTRLAANDKMNEYVIHNGSALFAVLPGIASGGWIGETLLG